MEQIIETKLGLWKEPKSKGQVIDILDALHDYKQEDVIKAIEKKFNINISELPNNLEEDEKKILKEEFLKLVNGKERKIAEGTELLVKYIMKYNYLYTTKDDLKSEMWIYKEGIYISQGRSEIKEILREVLQEWFNVYTYNIVVSKIEADTYIDQDKFFNQNNKNEIAVLNGILNLNTLALY